MKSVVIIIHCSQLPAYFFVASFSLLCIGLSFLSYLYTCKIYGSYMEQSKVQRQSKVVWGQEGAKQGVSFLRLNVFLPSLVTV